MRNSHAVTPPPIAPALARRTKLVGHLTTVSGCRLTFDGVLLYDIAAVREVEALRASIDKNLRGFRTGVGFIGDLWGVLMHAAAVGAIESMVSQGMSAQAAKEIEYCYYATVAMRNTGQFIALDLIENIKVPLPTTWRLLQRESSGHVFGGFVFSGDPIVAVRLADGSHTSLMWDKVEQYLVVEA